MDEPSLERPLTPRMVRAAAWGGSIALAVGTFLAVTSATLMERDKATVDRAVLYWMAHLRLGWLTGAMVDVTALGSPTLVTLFTIVTFAILLVLRDRRGALHLVIASVGTWILSPAMKGLIGRARPTEVE